MIKDLLDKDPSKMDAVAKEFDIKFEEPEKPKEEKKDEDKKPEDAGGPGF